MKNSEQPITPCMMQQVGETTFRANRYNDPKEYNRPMIGLTKREHFAAMAMQGLLSNPDWMNEHEGQKYIMQDSVISEVAIKIADALLKELEREK